MRGPFQGLSGDFGIGFPRGRRLQKTRSVRPSMPSPDSYQPLHRLNQLLRVIADTILEDDFDLLDVADIGGGVSFHHHQVGLFAGSEGADMRVLTKKPGAVETGNPYRFERGKAGFN